MNKEEIEYRRTGEEAVFKVGEVWWDWTRMKGEREGGVARRELDNLLGRYGINPQVKNGVLTRYDRGVFRFQQLIIASAHDERHMQAVVYWATKGFDRRCEYVPLEKRKMAVLAVAIAAVDHDRGDIPEKGMTEAAARRREDRSAGQAAFFIGQLAREGLLSDGECKELIALAQLLIVSTNPGLDVSYEEVEVEETLEDLPISKIVRTVFQQEAQESGEKVVELWKVPEEIQGVERRKLELLKKMTEDSARTLKNEFGWKANDLLEIVRIIDGADYASYYMEPSSIIRVMALWAELMEVYLNSEGNLVCLKPPMEDYAQWLTSDFRKKVFQLYENYLPLEAEVVRKQDHKLVEVLEKIRGEPKSDQLRFEGGLTPVDLYQMAEGLGLLENRLVQGALIGYSKEFMGNLDAADPSRFASLATAAIREIYKAVSEEKKQEFITLMLDQINELMRKENSSSDLHIAPFAYEEGFLANLVGVLDENQGNWGRIQGVTSTFRLDQDSPDKLNALLTTELPEERSYGISLGGLPTAETLEQTLVTLDEENYQGKLMIHFGLQTREKEAEGCLDLILKHVEERSPITLHLDDHYQWFLDWYKNLDSNGQALVNQWPIFVSPLINVMHQPEVLTELQEVKRMFPKLKFVSNNTTAFLAGAGLSLQLLLERTALAGPYDGLFGQHVQVAEKVPVPIDESVLA